MMVGAEAAEREGDCDAGGGARFLRVETSASVAPACRNLSSVAASRAKSILRSSTRTATLRGETPPVKRSSTLSLESGVDETCPKAQETATAADQRIARAHRDLFQFRLSTSVLRQKGVHEKPRA